MAKYYIDGEPEHKNHVWQRISCACQRQGGDVLEAAAVWQRAHSDDEDGEYARDELTSYVPGLEMVV
jgi:hypothetical protein